MSETLAVLDRVLAAVELLSAHRKAEVAELQPLIGIELARKENPGNPFFEVHVGRFAARPPFRTLEIRRPLTRPWTRGMVVIDLQPVPGLGWETLETRLGPPAEVTTPRPQAPRDMPLDLTWRRPWGELTFSVTRSEPAALVRAILDWKD